MNKLRVFNAQHKFDSRRLHQLNSRNYRFASVLNVILLDQLLEHISEKPPISPGTKNLPPRSILDSQSPADCASMRPAH